MESFVSKNRLILGIIAGVLLGSAVGSFFPEFGAGTQIIGELFLNALKMVVLPLIIVSITLSIMKVGNLGSLGLKTIAYYAATTAIAVSIGIVVVTMLQPGDGSEVLKGAMPEVVKSKEGFRVTDILRQISTPNLFKSAYEFQILPIIIASLLFGIAFGKLQGVGIILAVDWFLDRFRTTVNVWGDSIGAAVIEKLEFDENTG